jgi:hypothetical protein
MGLESEADAKKPNATSRDPQHDRGAPSVWTISTAKREANVIWNVHLMMSSVPSVTYKSYSNT